MRNHLFAALAISILVCSSLVTLVALPGALGTNAGGPNVQCSKLVDISGYDDYESVVLYACPMAAGSYDAYELAVRDSPLSAAVYVFSPGASGGASSYSENTNGNVTLSLSPGYNYYVYGAAEGNCKISQTYDTDVVAKLFGDAFSSEGHSTSYLSSISASCGAGLLAGLGVRTSGSSPNIFTSANDTQRLRVPFTVSLDNSYVVILMASGWYKEGTSFIQKSSMEEDLSVELSCDDSMILLGQYTVCSAQVTGSLSHGIPIRLSQEGGLMFWTQGPWQASDYCFPTWTKNGVCYFLVGKSSQRGSASMVATYPGYSNMTGISTSYVIKVTDVIVTCDEPTPVVGSNVLCKAMIVGPSPTGTITWSSNGPGVFSPSACKLSRGSCSVRYKATSVSSHVIINATYAPLGLSPSVGMFRLQVEPVTPKTTVACSPTSADAGTTPSWSTIIKCTAKVTGYSISGEVTWSQSGAGFVGMGANYTDRSDICTLTKGACSISVSGILPGYVVIFAKYNGDSNNLASSRGRGVIILPSS